MLEETLGSPGTTMDAKEDPLTGHARYSTLKYINKGSFGFVVLAENKETHETVAIKFVEVA